MSYSTDFATSAVLADFTMLNWRQEGAPNGQPDTQGNGPDVPGTIIVNGSGKLEVKSGMQNYGDSLVRLNRVWIGNTITLRLQPFPSVGGYARIIVTDRPYPAVGFDGENANGPKPKNGFEVNVGCPFARTWVDYLQADHWTGGSPGPCSGVVVVGTEQEYVITRDGETVTVTVGGVEALTFPCSFTGPGWVYIGSHNHASQKYASEETSDHYFDTLALDSAAGAARVAEVPPVAGEFFGRYLTQTEGSAETLVTNAVDLTTCLKAHLTVNCGFQAAESVDATSRLWYKINSGTAQQVPFQLAEHAYHSNFAFSIPINKADLVNGAQTIKIWVTDPLFTNLMSYANVSIVGEMTLAMVFPQGLVGDIPFKEVRVGPQMANRVVYQDIDIWNRVLSIPGAPSDLVAVAGSADNEVDLTWSAPSNNGGASITDYIIQRRTSAIGLGEPGAWGTVSDGVSSLTSYTVTSLSGGTSYDFQVAAVNSIGSGSYSTEATATPTGVPVSEPWLMDFSEYIDGNLAAQESSIEAGGIGPIIVDGWAECEVDWWWTRLDKTPTAPPSTSDHLFMSAIVDWKSADGGTFSFAFFMDNTDGWDGSRNVIVFQQAGSINLEHEFGGFTIGSTHAATTMGTHRFDLEVNAGTTDYTIWADDVLVATGTWADWRFGPDNHQVGFFINGNADTRVGKWDVNDSELKA